jgi:hypothetical protein
MVESKICPVCGDRYADWGWRLGPKVDGVFTWQRDYTHFNRKMKLIYCKGTELFDGKTRQKLEEQ